MAMTQIPKLPTEQLVIPVAILPAPRREFTTDFIYIMTGAVGAIGAAAVAWPFLDTLNPSADVLALNG